MGAARIKLARFTLRLGRFIQSLAVLPLKPGDLADFSRLAYAQPGQISDWSRQTLLADGLYPGEEALLSLLQRKSGSLLLLGGGGGRDAIGLARAGFAVTAVDFVAELLERARESASRQGLEIRVLTQEISRLDVPPGAFDIVWFSQRMYSTVPTRPRRTELLRRVARALKPEGLVVCQFHWDPNALPSPRRMRFLRGLAWLTFGNRRIEPGDQLWQHREFLHAFHDQEALKREFLEAELEAIHFEISPAFLSGGAILRRKVRA